MKKWFLFLLIFALSFTCVACGKDDEEGDGDDTPTYDSLEMSKSESQTKVAELAKNGYEFEARAVADGETTTFTTGATEDMYWFIQSDDDGSKSGSALKHENGMYHMYSFDGETWTFSASISDTQADLTETYKSLFNYWAYWCYNVEGYQKQGEVTIAGRTCNKYTLNYAGVVPSAGAISFTYEVDVDKATGMTMKVLFTGQAGMESAAVSYEVTRFVTGGAVNVPKLPDATLPE